MLEGNGLLMFLVFFPFAAGLVSYLIGRNSKRARDIFVIVVTAAELAAAIFLIASASDTNDFHWHAFAGLGVHLRGDGFRTIMAILAGFIWFFTTIISI